MADQPAIFVAVLRVCEEERRQGEVDAVEREADEIEVMKRKVREARRG